MYNYNALSCSNRVNTLSSAAMLQLVQALAEKYIGKILAGHSNNLNEVGHVRDGGET